MNGPLWAVLTGLCAIAAAAQDFPCKLNDYRIPDSKTLLVLCDGILVPPTAFSPTGSLFFVQDESIVRPAVQGNVTGGLDTQTWWLSFTFGSPLEGGKDYELQFDGSLTQPDAHQDRPSQTKPFVKARFRFTTKPQAMITEVPGAHLLVLQSHLALDSKSIATAKLSQKGGSGKFEDTHAVFTKFREPPRNVEYIGGLRITNGPNAAGSFKVEGLLDIFGQALEVDPNKHAPPISVPKDKTAANYYFNFLQQAGWGITPTWVADVKVAPLFGRLPGDLFWAPSLVVNVGNGSVGDTNATDLIKPSIGVTRLFRNNGFFEGIRVTPSFSYETDREDDKRNALFDGDVRFYFRGLSKTRAESQLDEFLKRRPKDKNLQLEDVKEFFGYSIQFFLGAAAGGALMDVTAKSSDKSSHVTVPAYSIVRIRPRMVTTFEFKALTITVTAIPRYLFTTENVTRQVLTPQTTGSAKQKIFLDSVSGWRPYAECGVNIALDPAGHFALGTTYKVGSQQPNFDRTNLFQSGLLVRF